MSNLVCAHCGKKVSEFDVRCPHCLAPLPGGPRVSGPVLARAPEALVGTCLAGYFLEAVLGRGGMGVVYRALDPGTRRAVALKLLAPMLRDEPRSRARLRREARTAAALDHPNLGRVLAIEEHDRHLFIVMDYYEGLTLAQRLERGALALAEAVRILRQIASGLGAAHAAGVVHRDLKPANVMLTPSGEVKLLDFGLALLLDPQVTTVTPLTQTGQVLGTLAYMSPEQIRAEPLDGRTDLWSFGVIAYEALTGRRPFHAKTSAGVLDGILTAEPAPVRALAPDLPVALETLVQGLLRKEREQRIGTAREVLQALENLPPL